MNESTGWPTPPLRQLIDSDSRACLLGSDVPVGASRTLARDGTAPRVVETLLLMSRRDAATPGGGLGRPRRLVGRARQEGSGDAQIGWATYAVRVREPNVERDVTSSRPAARGARAHASFARAIVEREEVRYLIVAGSTTVCYLGGLALLLATGLQYMYAILIAQAAIITLAFPAYRRLIFRSAGRWQADAVRFVGVWAGGFVAGVVATPALVELVGLSPLPAQVVAVAGVAVLSYLGHHFVSFRR